MIHLNEEALEGATARMPLEEVFAADISDEIVVFLRGDRRGRPFERPETSCKSCINVT